MYPECFKLRNVRELSWVFNNINTVECGQELKRRYAIAKMATTKLTQIWKDYKSPEGKVIAKSTQAK